MSISVKMNIALTLMMDYGVFIKKVVTVLQILRLKIRKLKIIISLLVYLMYSLNYVFINIIPFVLQDEYFPLIIIYSFLQKQSILRFDKECIC